jgi:hypothetical protein
MWLANFRLSLRDENANSGTDRASSGATSSVNQGYAAPMGLNSWLIPISTKMPRLRRYLIWQKSQK